MTTWTTELKNPLEYILLENGSFILQESGSKLYLEQPGNPNNYWTTETKS